MLQICGKTDVTLSLFQQECEILIQSDSGFEFAN